MTTVGDAINIAQTTGAQASSSSAPTASNVNSLLYEATGVNQAVLVYNQMDWARVAAQYGSDIAARDQNQFYGGIIKSERGLSNDAGRLGIPVTVPPAPEAAQGSTAFAPITVGAFSFQSGGSTYAVTPSADGSLIGTKDGKAWNTWQLSGPGSPSDASIALVTLTTDSAANGPHRQTSLIEVTA
jgi:hypothetical protein